MSQRLLLHTAAGRYFLKVFFLCFKNFFEINIFLVFSDYFDALILKIKKYYFNVFSSKKYFEKQ
jgi:hypothetical protein